jgi:hypothetical protein
MEPEKLTRCPYVDGDETQCDFSKTEQCSQLSPTVNKVMRQFESALARRRFYGPRSKH